MRFVLPQLMLRSRTRYGRTFVVNSKWKSTHVARGMSTESADLSDLREMVARQEDMLLQLLLKIDRLEARVSGKSVQEEAEDTGNVADLKKSNGESVDEEPHKNPRVSFG